MSKLDEIKAGVKILCDEAEKDRDEAVRGSKKTIQDYRESQTLPVSVIYEAFSCIVAARNNDDSMRLSSDHVMSLGEVNHLIDKAINLQEKILPQKGGQSD